MINKNMLPHEIEAASFEMITEILGERKLEPEHEKIIKRVIHTTADFEYADNLYFSPEVVDKIKAALQEGAHIITDTNMAKAGISTRTLETLNCRVHCFMADETVAEEAKSRGTTRAVVSMEKAAELEGPLIFVIGNAPTALIRICEMAEEGKIHPRAVIGVPVGFVNVVEAKEMLMSSGLPCIVSQGRKGGSTVAAAIMNAISYSLYRY